MSDFQMSRGDLLQWMGGNTKAANDECDIIGDGARQNLADNKVLRTG